MKISRTQKRRTTLAAACMLAFIPLSLRAEVEILPRQIGASIDVGQVEKGTDAINDKAEGTVITRTGVYMTYAGSYDHKLNLGLTVGGLFWYPFVVKATQPYERLIQFGPGVGQAQATYIFGDPSNTDAAKLQFGYFPMKYNPDSKNLGEYLYRSGTYPGYIWNGGWSYIDASSYMAQGARLTLPTFDKKVVHDITLFIERDIEPTGDLSPGYVLTVKPSSFLDFGAGVIWAHALSLNPDKLTPKPGTGESNHFGTYYDNRTKLPLTENDKIDTIPAGDLKAYTFKGFKTMARFSLNFGSLMDLDLQRAGEFKVYGEWAFLGVQNQPFYYDHPFERMPIMGGISIPTFRLLDQLSVEVEYHKSRFKNTVGQVFDAELPIPLGVGENYLTYTDSALAADKSGSATKDDWHWSVYARRGITEGVSVCAQVASDNMRQFDGEAKPSPTPTTLNTKDWYYVIRLEFGIF